jgi:hypothetical protein
MGMFPIANHPAVMFSILVHPIHSSIEHLSWSMKFQLRKQKKTSLYSRPGDVCVLKKWCIKCL